LELLAKVTLLFGHVLLSIGYVVKLIVDKR
jgi:hypothetical protein